VVSSIFRRNVSVYKFLCTLLTLPSPETLQKLTSEIVMEPGFHQTVFRTLEKRAARWSAKNRTCVLMFDEVAILKGIYVNSAGGYLDGFEDYGHLGRTSSIATHSLVFMIRGVNLNWKIPIGYFFTHNSVPSEVLKQLLIDAIKMCKSIGLNVVATLSDQGSTNRKASSMLRDTCEKGEYEPVYEIDGSTIVHLWDTPHLIKNIRNNLLISNLKFGSKGQFLAKWSDIIKYQKMDLLEFGYKSGLTHDHLYPTGRMKMRVKLAAQVLSYNVASAICSINVASEGRRLSDCLQTAKFLYNVDILFDICNGAGHRDRPKSQRCLVTENSIHHSLWQKFYKEMSAWKYVKRATHRDGTVSVHNTVPPCLSGWRDNLKGFQRLWFTLKSIGFTEMNLRRFNSDPIENLFSVIRQTNGSNRSPTCKQFEYSFKTCAMNGMSHYHIRNKNCLDDDSVALATEKALFSNEDLAVNSNLFVPDRTTILTRGQPSYLGSLMKTQPSRQAISLQCNKICTILLKKCAMDCQICCTAVLDQNLNSSTDHMFSANLQNTLSCLEVDQDSICYAQVAAETHANMQKPGSYASSKIIDLYFNSFKKFLTSASYFIFAHNSVSLTEELISENKNFDWLLKCTEHSGSLKLSLVKAISISFLSRICALVNKNLRDTLKHKKLISKLKAKRVCAVESSDPDDPDWEDISADEILEIMLTESCLPGGKGKFAFGCICCVWERKFNYLLSDTRFLFSFLPSFPFSYWYVL